MQKVALQDWLEVKTQPQSIHLAGSGGKPSLARKSFSYFALSQFLAD
ncbi:MAG: hypothetical protein V7K46_26465 [Nostoc sp.]